MKTPIFDLDGTLVNTDCLDPFISNLIQYPFKSKEREEAKKELISHFKDCSTYHGIEQVLEYIRVHNITASIVSNAPKFRLYALAEQFGLPIDKNLLFHKCSFNRFGTICKPNPIPIIEAMKRMNSTPSNSLMIGNSTEDILAANNAHIASVACLWGVKDGTLNEILDLNPTFTIKQPNDLIPIIAT